MKTILCLILLTAIAKADHYVNGYVRSSGTYVQPHMQSNSNSNSYDNYSTRGNTNPYTGSSGTVNPYGTQTQRPTVTYAPY